jgi:hypothetical protein
MVVAPVDGGDYVTAIYKFGADTIVGSASGVFSLLNVDNSSVQISNVYVMGEEGFAEFTK